MVLSSIRRQRGQAGRQRGRRREEEAEEEGDRGQGGCREKEWERMVGDQPVCPPQLLLQGWGAVLLSQCLSSVSSQVPDPEVRARHTTMSSTGSPHEYPEGVSVTGAGVLPVKR